MANKVTKAVKQGVKKAGSVVKAGVKKITRAGK